MEHVTTVKRERNITKTCVDCGVKINKKSNSRCKACHEAFVDLGRNIISNHEIEWPPVHKLADMVWEEPLYSLAQSFGATTKILKKYCKKHHIKLPPRGYWKNNNKNKADSN